MIKNHILLLLLYFQFLLVVVAVETGFLPQSCKNDYQYRSAIVVCEMLAILNIIKINDNW